MNATLVIVVVALYAVDRESGVQMAALVATTIFATTLIPARLLGLQWLKRLQPDLLRISYQGKWLGIWTCIWYVLYAALAIPVYYPGPFDLKSLLQRETILLSISLLIFVVLLGLSNKWSYANVKWWKQINMLIWLAVPYLFTHFLLAAHVYGDFSSFWGPWVLLGLMALAGISGMFRAKRDHFAMWRLNLLIVGSAISALVVWSYPAIL